MPFSANGTYTPPTGATNATPGSVIKSATWNTIFTDMSTALTSLGQGTFVPTPRTVSTPGNFTVNTTDSVILVQTSTPTIVLPLSSTKTGMCRIMGNASSVFGTATALLVTTSPDTINGVGTVTLATNYQVINLYPLSSGGYIKW